MTDHNLISIITPAFNEAKNLPILYSRFLESITSISADWEWLIIDDHSNDKTFGIAKHLVEKDARVRCFRLSHNFGSHKAIRCGLDQARGTAAIVMAADLQDSPQLIPQLLERWQKGFQVVWGARNLETKTQIGFFSKLYYWLMRKFVGFKEMPQNGADCFLVDKHVLKTIKQFNETNVSIFALLSWIGFKQSIIYYEKDKRIHGGSGWTFEKKLKLLIDSVTSFSYFPIRIISLIGIIFALAGFIYAVFVGSFAFAQGRPLGWTSLMIVILITSGVQMLMLGLLGEYLWRALEESRRRPQYIIEDSIERD